MTRYRIEAQEFEGDRSNFGISIVDGGGTITPKAVTALGIVEVVPEFDAIVSRRYGGVGVWEVRRAPGAPFVPASFVERDDAVAWAREKFGPNVKVED